jgi:hypothetical protein
MKINKTCFFLALTCITSSTVAIGQLPPHKALAHYQAKAATHKKNLDLWKKSLLATTLLTGTSACAIPILSGLGASDTTKKAFGAAVMLSAASYLTLSYITDTYHESHDWLKSLEKLTKDNISNKTTVEIGGKRYLLAKNFDDISNIYTDNHYEIYLMPWDHILVYIFTRLLNTMDIYKMNQYKKDIAFIAIRATPGISMSACSRKPLPRIIISLKPNSTKDVLEAIIDIILCDVYCTWFVPRGVGRPRYSDEMLGSDKNIYVGFGSGDYKETAKGQREYAPMKSTSYWRFFSRNVEDMAYQNENQRPRQSINWHPPQ